MQEPDFKPKNTDPDFKYNEQQRKKVQKAGSVIKQQLQAKQNKLYVHMFPHSHTDLGWISTLNDYYFGVRVGPKGEYLNSARAIIETSIRELE